MFFSHLYVYMYTTHKYKYMDLWVDGQSDIVTIAIHKKISKVFHLLVFSQSPPLTSDTWQSLICNCYYSLDFSVPLFKWSLIICSLLGVLRIMLLKLIHTIKCVSGSFFFI